MRITPTCVGTTVEQQPVLTDYEDHPHVRGDNDGPCC